MRARTGAPRVATFYRFGLGLSASASPTQIGDGNPRGLSLTQKASEGPTSQEDPGSDSQDADPLPTTAGWKERPDELRRHADKKLPRPLGAHKRGQTSQAAFCTPGPPPTHPLGSGALLTPSSGPPGAERGPPAPGRHARPGSRTPAGGDLCAPSPCAAPPPPSASQRPFVSPSPGTLVPEKFQEKNRRDRPKRRAQQSGQGRWDRAKAAQRPKVSPPRPQGRGERRGLREITRALDYYGVGEQLGFLISEAGALLEPRRTPKPPAPGCPPCVPRREVQTPRPPTPRPPFPASLHNFAKASASGHAPAPHFGEVGVKPPGTPWLW
ncbi:PREDICTED: basic proline-rich protein-like isoform X2 [Hipposideros armiger]|uniref:Basic proline-rich protein-like isoform X2 n=1 Tax=Hipposideros armiger TaxID=186990 RepID=A0A8B7QXL9_HIPAR|nr:PREDICTED: basic proline-rich protein-like isoform X2 [Hipposideros armiger]